MKLKIEKIHLHNFRQFSGDTCVEFSTEEDKNITVIHAMNGSGKTTFLQSFYWTLYEELNLPNSGRLLNENLFSLMNNGDVEEVFVEIIATHEEAVYTIKRSLNVTKDLTGDMKNSKILFRLKLYR
jgi:DNA sulfur modification protein DndD